MKLQILTLALLLTGALAAHTYPPDSVPGVIDPVVKQSNIMQTVCVANYTATVRPPTSYTNALKRADLAQFKLPGKLLDYELDHRVDLAAGGDPRDPRNLWMQPWPEARLKDRLETYTHRQLCSGKMTLGQVQAIFLGDFWKEYDRLAPLQGWPTK